jgi:hypothetical protein
MTGKLDWRRAKSWRVTSQCENASIFFRASNGADGVGGEWQERAGRFNRLTSRDLDGYSV